MVDEIRFAAIAQVEAAGDAARAAARSVSDPDLFTPSEAAMLVRGFDRIERAASAAKALLARKATSPAMWKGKGFASAADYYASITGSSVGAAKTELATSEALPGLPATREALLSGSVSASQGQIVADGAKVNPGAEADLLAGAKRGRSHRELREDALRAKAAADADRAATEARIHAGRRCGEHTDAEGAWNLHAKGTPVDGSVIKTELDVLADQIFRDHRSSAAVGSAEGYRFDALKRMAENSQAHRLGATSGATSKQPPAGHLALLRLDLAALRRGHLEDGELCEIAGIGPVSLAAARELLGDAVLKLVLTNGVDVANITSLTRRPTQAQHYAKLWTNPICMVEGCARTRIEFDHIWGKEFVKTKHTRLDELEGKCHHHHDLHTRHGWELVVGTGKRPLVPPDHPGHPANQTRGTPPLAGAPPTATGPPGTGDQVELFGDAAA